MNRKLKYIGAAALAVLVIASVILFPVLISRLQDGRILNVTHLSAAEGTALGYRYELSVPERLEIIQRSQSMQEEVMQRYEYRPSAYMEKEHVLTMAKEQIEILKSQKVLPEFSFDFGQAKITAQLFSYIDLTAPSLNVYLWQVDFMFGREYIHTSVDAKTGKVYEFQICTDTDMLDAGVDLQAAAQAWGDYLGLSFIKAEERSLEMGLDAKGIKYCRFIYEQDQKQIEYVYFMDLEQKNISLSLNGKAQGWENAISDFASSEWEGQNRSIKIK